MTLKELWEKIGLKKKEIKPTPFPPVEPIGELGEPGPVHHGDRIPVDPPVPKPVATKSTGKKKK